MKTPNIIVWVLIAYCVFVLVTGAVRADAVIPPVPDSSDPDCPALGHGPFPQALIDRLEQQGVDVTEVKTALQNNDTDAVKAWLDAYRTAHPDEMMKGPGPMNPGKIIDRLGQQGVDITEVKAAFGNGDTEAVKAWLDAYREAHKNDVTARHKRGEEQGRDPARPA